MAPATACVLLPGCEAHPTDGTEKRFALRLTLADCNCQCTVVLYHELVLRAAASMGCTLSDTVHDSPAVRLQLRDLFRGAQWLCRFTFRENDYQQKAMGMAFGGFICIWGLHSWLPSVECYGFLLATFCGTDCSYLLQCKGAS